MMIKFRNYLMAKYKLVFSETKALLYSILYDIIKNKKKKKNKKETKPSIIFKWR